MSIGQLFSGEPKPPVEYLGLLPIPDLADFDLAQRVDPEELAFELDRFDQIFHERKRTDSVLLGHLAVPEHAKVSSLILTREERQLPAEGNAQGSYIVRSVLRHPHDAHEHAFVATCVLETSPNFTAQPQAEHGYTGAHYFAHRHTFRRPNREENHDAIRDGRTPENIPLTLPRPLPDDDLFMLRRIAEVHQLQEPVEAA